MFNAINGIEHNTTTCGVTKPTVVLLHSVAAPSVDVTEQSIESGNAVRGSHCLINTHFTSGNFNVLCEALRSRGGRGSGCGPATTNQRLGLIVLAHEEGDQQRATLNDNTINKLTEAEPNRGTGYECFSTLERGSTGTT